MIWVTTSKWRATDPRLLRKVSAVYAGDYCSSIALVEYSPLGLLPEDYQFVLNLAERAIAVGPSCNFYAPGTTLCRKLKFTAFGILVFSRQDAWWPPGFNPTFPETWINYLAIIQFIPQVDMSEGQLDAALQAATNLSPHWAEQYVEPRLDALKEIISRRILV